MLLKTRTHILKLTVTNYHIHCFCLFQHLKLSISIKAHVIIPPNGVFICMTAISPLSISANLVVELTKHQ